MNQTLSVRTAINVFIVIAIGVSLLQELLNVSASKPAPSATTTTPDGQVIPPEPTGPKLQGIRILSSDSFQNSIKELLAKKQLNIEIVQYEFEGNEYWMNMLANWGHVAIIFYFMTKHKSQTDGNKKKQIMIMGAIAVVGWFYLSPRLKPQRLGIQVKGVRVYQKDYWMQMQVSRVLQEEQFEIEQMNEGMIKGDAWQQRRQVPSDSGSDSRQQRQFSQEYKRVPRQDELMDELEF